MRALIISSDGFEDSELVEPWQALKRDGIATDIASPEREVIMGKHGYMVAPDVTLDEVKIADYDLLLLPGGKAPSVLRKDVRVLALVKAFAELHRPIAAICHGPQILLSAGVLAGHTATCYKSVALEMIRKGVHYVDREVVVDDGIITSRKPADISAFMQAIRHELALYDESHGRASPH